MEISVVRGDICTVTVDAVVTAGNRSLVGGSGVKVLAAAYRASLARADEVGARSVAFPAISTGVYGYPVEEAARVSVEAIRGADTQVEKVVLVAFGEKQARLWERELER
jgi:O-acetyl-ADP-ribose deacetylase (regulator of RNase III)